jgi:hypothetical protein
MAAFAASTTGRREGALVSEVRCGRNGIAHSVVIRIFGEVCR